MKRIYEHANEQHIRAFVVYGKEGKLYTDVGCANAAKNAEVKNAFDKCCLIVVDGDTSLRPVCIEGGVVKTIGVTEGSGALTLVEWESDGII